MLLNKSNILEEASERFSEKYTIESWTKKETEHEVYVFSLVLNNQEELIECWEEAKGYIAAYVQGLLLEKDVEKWNLYLIFLVKDDVDPHLKYQIEQDKFSSRKIVIDDFHGDSEDDIMTSISETLFNITIRDNPIENTKTIQELLKEKHQDVFDFIEETKGQKKEDVFEDMLTILGE